MRADMRCVLSQFAVIIGDLTYSDDYTADATPNRFYTGAQFGVPISPTLNPIATSYQPRVTAYMQHHPVTALPMHHPVEKVWLLLRSGMPGAASCRLRATAPASPT